jgi:NADPH2:quinone reductase
MQMQCVEIERPGLPEVMRVVERPRPIPEAGEVLIRVAAAGVNRGDAAQRMGHYPPPPGASDVPGLEVSGTIAELGEGVTTFRIGDNVCALLAGGGYATYCTVAATQCLPVPNGVSLVDAAGLAETCFTVWSTVWGQGRLEAGETLLVHGGASGIGTTAIQMAAALGHRVFVTAGGPERCAACVELGASLAIDYHREDFVEAVHETTGGKGVDVILDMVAGDYVARDIAAAASGGRVVFISFLGGRHVHFDVMALMQRRITLTGSTLRAGSTAFKHAIAKQLIEHIWPRIESGSIRPVTDRVYELADVVKAHQRLESGNHIGKILIRMPGY